MQLKIDSIRRLDKEMSWMIGIWTGDNFSSREGTVIRKGRKSSGRFGIINNDEEIIARFLKGLEEKFCVSKIKIDVHMPRHAEFDKEKIKKHTSTKFGIEQRDINVYYSSPWRRKIGYAVYTNNTALLRFVNEKIYRKLSKLIKENKIHIKSLLQGIADGEGDVDKANKSVGIINTDEYVIRIIKFCLKELRIPYKIRVDERNRTYFRIKELDKFCKTVGFYTERKQKALEEMLQGNFCRQKDIIYFDIFSEYLKNGATVKDVHEKTKIPYSTVTMILRNLSSNGKILRKKQKSGRAYHYVYRLSTTLLI